MKKLATLTVFAFLTGNTFAAMVTQYLKLVVTENSNITVQTNQSFVYAFSSTGLNNQDAGDAGNQYAFPSNIGNDVYPFSLNDNNDVVSFQDSRPDLFSYKRIKMGFYSKLPGTIKVTSLAYGSCADSSYRPAYAWLEQISTGLTFDILHDTATINIQDNINFNADFYLHIGPYIKVSAANETCFGSNDGQVFVDNTDYSNWTLSFYQGTNLVFTNLVSQPDTTVENLAPGNYTAIVTVNNVAIMNVPLTVNAGTAVVAGFTFDIPSPTTDDMITFTSTSTGAVNFTWDFGNGDNDVNDIVSYQYPFTGQYIVALTAINEAGCQSTAYDTITVSTGSGSPELHPLLSSSSNTSLHSSYTSTVTSRSNADIFPTTGQRITIAQKESKDLWVVVLNTSGQIVMTKESSDTNIELNVQNNGAYIVKVVAADGTTQSKTIMVAN